MLDENEGRSNSGRKMLEKVRYGRQSAGRRADTDDKK
jgi:hypothetical protein